MFRLNDVMFAVCTSYDVFSMNFIRITRLPLNSLNSINYLGRLWVVGTADVMSFSQK